MLGNRSAVQNVVYRSVQICTFGDSIEGKLVTVVDELKGFDCGNATEYF